MAGAKRDRQRSSREARAAALAAAKRRDERRRRAVVGAIFGVVLVLAIVSILLAKGGSTKKKVATSGTTTATSTATSVATSTPGTTSAPAVGSAAGKPCMAASDPLPAGAPAVPVEVGPPPTQLVSHDLKAGTGATVAPNATVTVNYIGVSCSTGKIFDSSYATKQPVTFPLGQVIKGWQDGIPGMKVGGQRVLGIPPTQAYGSAGKPPTIAPDETLWFVVEVLDAKAA